jgi:hypothetical protein
LENWKTLKTTDLKGSRHRERSKKMGVRKYQRMIDPDKVNGIRETIHNRFNSDEPGSIVELAVCHKLMQEKIDYHLSGSRIHDPDKMLDKLSGDCQDHTVLLGSLYKACGRRVGIVLVSDHVFLEVDCPLPDVEEACDSLRRFYYRQFDYYPEEISFEHWKDDNWFIVDTAGGLGGGWSSHVGDIRSHDKNYLEKSSDGSWRWTYLEKKEEV